MIIESLRNGRRAAHLVVLGLTLDVLLASGCCRVPPELEGQKPFAEPDAAVLAIKAAASEGDKAELMAILGPEGQDIVSSGDPVADANQRQVFVTALEQGWRLERIDETTLELVVGDEQWPFPIPLVRSCGAWRFDTAEGRVELLARRIGRDELAAIGVCRLYVVAQNEYAGQAHDDRPAGIYAQKVHSTSGKHDGLYWVETGPDEPSSPLGALAAQAASEGYATEARSTPKPFYGYFFRILTRQGEDAPGGAKDYVVEGDMKDGFALIAYPADYGNSGIMSFMVGPDGTLYEADLGEDTLRIAGQITEFSPGAAWRALDGE